MSTRKGANLRCRPQKHKNRTVFKNDLYGATPQIKFLNTMNVCEVCEHCKEVIDWKIKYKKYKPLSQPKTCQKCGLRNVRKAYHVNCTDCSLKLRCCAKCNKSADDVNILPPEPTPQEQMKLDQEMQLLIKKLPERKRRTFLRYMKKGKKKQKEGEEDGQNGDGDSDPDVDSDGDEEANKGDVEPVEKVKEKTIPYTKEELLQKLEQMKLALENDEDFEDDFFGSDFDEEEDEDDLDDDDEEEEDDDEDTEEEQKPVDVKKKGVTFENGVKK